MERGGLVVLGVGLIILWLAGLGTGSAPWLTWLDGIGGLLSIVVGAAAMGAGFRVASQAAGWSALLAAGLFVLWIIALGLHTSLLIAWWTFGFACAYTLLALFSAVGARGSQRSTPHVA